ncbi:MFS transporter [Streptomyces varsoviensis]|nr:MFS transporter [Streptomyces varsoviensis]
MIRTYRSLLQVPGAARFSAAAFVGRLPVPMLGLGVVLLVSARSGSYGTAGVVAAVTMLGYALTAPLAGRFVDRFGQRRVLLVSAAVHGAGLVTLMSATTATVWLLCLAGIVTGASRPSTGTMVRTRWAYVLPTAAPEPPAAPPVGEPSTPPGHDNHRTDSGERAASWERAARRGAPPAVTLETAFSFEAVLDEVTFIAGPVLVTALATRLSPWAGLLCCLVLTVGGATALALQRATEPPPLRSHEHRGSALTVPGMPVITAVAFSNLLGVGVLDLAIVARADSLGSRALSGPLLAMLAVGSMLGGLWYGSRAWRAAPRVLWLRCLGVQVVGLVPLALSPGLPALVVAMLVAGLTVAPIGVSGLVLMERLLPPHLLTEGMAAETAAMALGAAVGGWLSGTVVEALGAARALALPAAAAALAFLIAVCCSRSIASPTADADAVAATVAEECPPPPPPGRGRESGREKASGPGKESDRERESGQPL